MTLPQLKSLSCDTDSLSDSQYETILDTKTIEDFTFATVRNSMYFNRLLERSNLRSLDIDSSDMTTLHIESHNTLEKIRLNAWEELKTVSIKNCKQLKDIELRNCYPDQMSLSNLPAVTYAHLNLWHIDCYSSCFEDIRKLKALERLSLFLIPGNEKIDLSTLTNLQWIVFDYPHIKNDLVLNSATKGVIELYHYEGTETYLP